VNAFSPGDRVSLILTPVDGLPQSFSASVGIDAELVGWSDIGLTVQANAFPNQIRFYPWSSIQYVAKSRPER
jgi:hypothetical protein